MDLLNKHKPSFTIKIAVNYIYWIIYSFLGLNLLFLGGTWLCKSELLTNTKFSVQLLLALFNLLEENVVASWYSSMLYFLIGIIAFFCYLVDEQKSYSRNEKVLNAFWIFVSIIFFLLSFDEMGSFHEVIGETDFLKSIGNGKDTGWFIFHFVIGAIGISMCLFFSLKFKRYPFPLAMNLLAILLLLSNPLQEEFEMEAWRSSLNQLTWKRPMLFIILEEGSEIFASFFFLYSFTVYLIKKTIISYSGKTMLSIDFTFNKYFFELLITLLILLGALMLSIFYFPWTFSGRSDVGLPQNWFPSIASIFSGFVCLYFEFSFKKKLGFLCSIYILLALISIGTSVYFGANLYFYRDTFLAQVRFILLGATLVVGLILIIEFKGNDIKKYLSAWLLTFIISIYYPAGFYTTFLAYVAYSFLLIALYLHFQRLLYLRDNYE